VKLKQVTILCSLFLVSACSFRSEHVVIERRPVARPPAVVYQEMAPQGPEVESPLSYSENGYDTFGQPISRCIYGNGITLTPRGFNSCPAYYY
jgi:hypothetical protein